jgi:hypothetical protein
MALLGSQIDIPETPVATTVPAPTEQAKKFISPEATVSHQLETLLAAGSPLITRAETGAKEQAQRSGLLSSSLAAGAGRRAAFETALPIAKADAETFARSGLLTQEGAQKLSLVGRQAGVTSALGAQEAGEEKELSAQRAAEAGILSAQEAEQAEELTERKGRISSELSTQQAQELEARDVATAAQTRQLETLRNNASFRELEARLTNDLQATMENVDAKDRGAYADSVRGVFQQYSDSYARVQTDPNLDKAAKDTIISNMNARTQAQVGVLSKLYGLSITWS